MEFRTSKQWKHQIGLTDNGFYFDSNFFLYADVDSLTGIPSRTSVNTAHYQHLDEFYFEILLRDGQLLSQEVKTSHRAKSVFFMGNTVDASRELSLIYKILLQNTLKYRYQKYLEYAENNEKWLLYFDKRKNIILSADDKHNFFLNEELIGNRKDGTVEIWQLANKCTICFARANSSSMFSKGFEANISIFKDHDILQEMFRLAGLHSAADNWLIND